MNVDKLVVGENLSWRAYHASCNQTGEGRDYYKSISCLLPLFYENAKSVAMIRYGMNIVKNAVNAHYTGQIPIITADQPLYALCKEIQWRWPVCYGKVTS